MAQGQPVKAIHIKELRDRVLGAWISSGSTDIRWLVADQLGTPRMIFDPSGSLANTSRHDYLPFGEELSSVVGLRSSSQGYTNNDGARQKFTSYERDSESGLDYAQARYYASMQGRFTGVDPLSGDIAAPQSLNRYTYVGNSPLNATDPAGLAPQSAGYGYYGKGGEPMVALYNQEGVYDGTGSWERDTPQDKPWWEYEEQPQNTSSTTHEQLHSDAQADIPGNSEDSQRRFSHVRIPKIYLPLINWIRKSRAPDFYILTFAYLAEGSVALTRGCTFTINLGASSGGQVSLMAGWLLQLDKPLESKVIEFLTGPSGSAAVFWNHRTGLGAGVGGGFIRAPQNPGTRWAVLVGLGVGGGGSAGHGWAPDWAELTRRYFPGRN